MKVAIIYPDYAPGSRPGAKGLGSFSEGIGSIAAVLKRSGHSVKLFHLTGPPEPGRLEDELASWRPDVVGFSIRSSAWEDMARLARSIQKDGRVDAALVAGGYHPTLALEDSLEAGGFDFALGGEADFTFRDLCEAIGGGSGYPDIPGLGYRAGGRIRTNLPGAICEDLDELPFPDVEIFHLPRLESFALDTLPAMLSRGCPFSCSYCCNAAFRSFHGSPRGFLRFRSPENSIAYLKAMMLHFPGAKYVSFMDNILPLKRSWFRRFASLYQAEIGLPYACNARVDLFSEEVASLLGESGCYRVHFGVESGDPALRAGVLGRGMSDESISRAFEMCRREGIATLTYNMVGLPRETPSHAWKTVELNALLRSERILAPTFYPYPGSEARRESLRAGRIVLNAATGQAVLDQPGFGWRHAEFASLYFRTFVRLCRLALGLPRPARRPALSLLRWSFCWPGMPHATLNAIGRGATAMRNRIQAFAKTRFKDAYLWARNRSLGDKIRSLSSEKEP